MLKILKINKTIPDTSSFLKRFFAQLIDILISLLIYIGLYSLLNQFLDAIKSDIIFDITHVFVAYIVFYIFYSSLFEFSALQATPGKLILGIQVVDINLERIKFLKSLIRTLLKFLSLFLFFLGFLLIIFSKERFSLHDILTKTFVIKKKRI